MLRLTVWLAYCLANLFLMMWVGFGGAQRLMNFLDSFMLALVIYALLCVLLIFVPLMKTSVEFRNSVRYGIFAPWALILLIAVPQFGHDPAGVFKVCIGAAMIWFSYLPGERLVKSLRRGSDDLTDRSSGPPSATR